MKKTFLIISFSLFLFPLATFALTDTQCSAGGGNFISGVCYCPDHSSWSGDTCECNFQYTGSNGNCTLAQSGGDGTGGDGAGGEETGGEETAGGSEIENPIVADDFQEIINSVINLIFYVGLVVTPLMVIIAGLMILTARDDAEQVKKGRQIILYAMVGLFIILFARGIISILNQVLGVKSGS
jgi:hypothetical protein